MPPTTTEPPIGRVEEVEDDLIGDDSDDGSEAGEVRKRVSRLAVEGTDAGVDRACGREQGAYKIGGGGGRVRSMREDEDAGVRGCRFSGPAGGRTLPPPHAWLAVEDTKKSYASDPEEQWMRVLGGGQPQRPQRRSSFSVVRRERAAREAWLDQAWEMKKSWHERNGGAPDADTPVVVVLGKGPSSSSPFSQAAGSVGGGGVAMDMEEVRACRDLGLELPSDCTVEIQCYGLSAGSSPTHSASGGDDSPSAGSCSIASPGEDPMDVKARLKVWAQAVALASTGADPGENLRGGTPIKPSISNSIGTLKRHISQMSEGLLVGLSGGTSIKSWAIYLGFCELSGGLCPHSALFRSAPGHR